MKGGKMEYTKEQIQSKLKQNTLKVTFTKTDGTVREMVCTLQESFIMPYEKKTGKVKPENSDILAVWEIEKEQWRSFRIDSIINAVIVEDPVNV